MIYDICKCICTCKCTSYVKCMCIYIYIQAPSHQLLKSVIIIVSKCYRFLKSVLSFSKPQLNFQESRCLAYYSPLY